jgi:histidinol phosphatase-like enzyme
MARLRALLREHDLELDAIYFCPHRPEDDCPCRKPKPGLLLRAAEDQILRLSVSTMVGDKLIDAATGRAAGAGGVLVRTGYGREEESLAGGTGPDAVCDDLSSAVRWALERGVGPD